MVNYSDFYPNFRQFKNSSFALRFYFFAVHVSLSYSEFLGTFAKLVGKFAAEVG